MDDSWIHREWTTKKITILNKSLSLNLSGAIQVIYSGLRSVVIAMVFSYKTRRGGCPGV